MTPHWSDQITEKFVRDVANRYMQENGLQVFDIFPKVNSNQLSGYIAKYTKADWLKIGTVADYKRTGSVESVGDDYTVSKQTYTLQEYAFHKDISKDDRNEYDNPFDPVRDAVDFVLNRLDRVILSEFVTTFIAASVWGTDTNKSAAKWSTKSSGVSTYDPVDDVLGWKQDIEKVTGYSPNRLIMAPDVFKALKGNTNITDRMKTTTDKVVTADLLARLFELETVKVLSAVNSGATDYMIAGKAILIYTPNRPTKFAPSAGYILTYRQNNMNVLTKRIKMEHLNDALRIEAMLKIDPVVLATDLGMYIYNLV